ncbi:MAG TPA: galactose-1-phosphate uridylyltransferase [Syntrophorhabdaceae bacterium]|nr:galactose-1-phosphate uridylyltransferase [Syntrophorhabdaceae bacterium]HPU29033.1 galactose-1-phosphate uridylyltransferase [Syntrophorhabdaceae bacterium]
MPELRKDPIIDRWVIISTERGKRPVFFIEEAPSTKTAICPLCPGNEYMTPPEVFAIRTPGSSPNGPGWHTRVVPNKFPALRIEGDLDKEGIGIFDKMNGIGAHEVIIETPNHGETIADMDLKTIQNIFIAYKERVTDLYKDKRFKYIMIFKNHGSVAGASLDHSHSQLIALPIVPRRVLEEINGGLTYYKFKDRCIFCDMINQELDDNERVVYQNELFIALSPFASRFPFEIWILPKKHESNFITHSQSESYFFLAECMSVLMKKYVRLLNAPPYNFIFHMAPKNESELSHFHWHIEIIPRLTKMAGFEWGTGFYINPTPPEEATIYLKETEV